MGTVVLFLPLAAQGIVTLLDEFYFHHRRGLGKWEVWGHPLDTLTVAAAYGFLLLTPPTTTNLWIFGALALFSCLFVTKDEFVHHELCDAKEQWLHALLFLLHPVAFLAAGRLWWEGVIMPILGQLALVLLFLFYQIIYWGIPWRTK